MSETTATVPTQAADPSATEPRVDPTIPAATPDPSLFHRAKNFSITILDPAIEPDGKKACIVRFPSDTEWCDRARQLVSVRKSLDQGRAKTETVREPEVNAALFNKIRIDKDGPAFDDAEAMYVINRLEQITGESCTRLGVNYTITLRTFNGKSVTHELRMPSQKQRMDFGRAAIQIISNRQTLETKFALEPVRDLWEKLKVPTGIKGYSSAGVPVVHMSAAINELLAQVDADAEAMERDPE